MKTAMSLDQIFQHSTALGSLQGSLLSASDGQAPRSLLVTSGRDQEGKSCMAVAVSAALTQQGATVLLMEGNFRHPGLSDLFEIPASPGLRELLRGSAGAEIIQKSKRPRLSILPIGAGGSFSELVGSFSECLSDLSERFDYVVIDGDSVLGSSEAAFFAAQVDGVILVAECEQTKWEILSLCKDKLSRAGGRVLGVLLNKRHYYIPGGLYEKV